MEKRKLFHLLAKIHNIPLEEAEVIYWEPGSRLGPDNRYEIIDLLGTGTLGAVYLAKDYQDEGSMIALKIILPYVYLNSLDKRLELFNDYLSVLRGIEHPNVLRYKGTADQDNLRMYKIEYLRGPSLKKWMHSQREQHKKIGCAEVCTVFWQICQGLSVLHKYSGHYRLHPENLVFAQKSPEQIKICDFGIYYLQPNNFWREIAVTLDQEPYLPPEQQKKLVKLGLQSDIFSLGMLLHESLTGQCPGHPGAKPSDYRRDIPAALDRLVSTALQENIAKRQKDIQEFGNQLREVIDKGENAPVHEEPDTTTDRQKVPVGKYTKDLPKLLKTARLEPDARVAREVTRLVKPKVDEAKKPAITQGDEAGKSHPDARDVALPAPTGGKSTEVGKISVRQRTLVTDKERAYAKYVELAQKMAKKKKWPESIEYCKNALQIKEGEEATALLETSRNSLLQAEEYKRLAMPMVDDPSSCLDLLRQSMEIYPEDSEVKDLYNKIEQEMVKKNSVQNAIDTGDALVGQERYEEALQTWREALEISENDKELTDRIMQVVDMLGETARQYLEQGQIYQAREILERIIDYTDDLLIIELFEEIDREIQERERQIQETWNEGEKHFEKKQFAAAIEVWKSVLELTDQDDFLLKRIKEAKELHERHEKDEQQYLRMSSLAIKLEQQEKYEEALQTWQKIQQQQSTWIYSTREVSKEIERLTKLVAASGVSWDARKILLEVEQAIKQGKFDSASSLLANPLFHRKLLPKVEEKYHDLLEKIDEGLARRKRFYRILWLVAGIFAAAAVIFINLRW